MRWKRESWKQKKRMNWEDRENYRCWSEYQHFAYIMALSNLCFLGYVEILSCVF